MKKRVLSRNDVYSGDLILVNASHPYRETDSVSLVSIANEPSTVLMERHAATLLAELMKKIHGWEQILPVSGWRSHLEQTAIWNDTLRESGEAFTRKFVALPGHSEHETGLAIDLGLRGADLDVICPTFPYEGICESFRRHAADYGFIERYPAGKETITGIGHEPWHFRYVGVPHAWIMRDKGITLEEYIELLKDFPFNRRPLCYQNYHVGFTVSYLESRQENMFFDMEDDLPYAVSGNNGDGFIITEWRHANGRQNNWRT